MNILIILKPEQRRCWRMSKDIKKALEHCIEWNCADCPNREELGSGEIVCRGRLLPEILEYISDLQHKLKVAERTTKLACDYLNAVEGDKLYELCKDIYNDNDYLMAKMNYFKEQAESELKGEKL